MFTTVKHDVPDVLNTDARRLELPPQVWHRPHMHVTKVADDAQVILLIALVGLGAEVDVADATQLGALMRRQLVLGARFQARK